MRVAYVLSAYPTASETFIEREIAALRRRGCAIDVYADVPGDAGLMAAAGTVRYPAEPIHTTIAIARAAVSGSPVRAFRWLRAAHLGVRDALTAARFSAPAAFRSRPYHAIHAHFGPNGVKAAAMRRAGVFSGPLIVTFHGYDLTSYVREHGEDVYTRVFAEGDVFLPVTQHWAERLAQLGCDPARIIVHRMGVDMRTQPVPAPAAPPVVLISIARLVEKKGISDALDALALLPAAERPLYRILGDGPERAGLESRAAALGLGGHVEFAGWQPPAAVAAALRDAHVLLVPSVTAMDGDQEGLPVAIMEAMAAGRPVIATRHSGIPELVRDDEEGILVPERDAQALAAAIRTLAADPALRERMGRSARARVSKRHDADRLAGQLLQIYARARRMRSVA